VSSTEVQRLLCSGSTVSVENCQPGRTGLAPSGRLDWCTYVRSAAVLESGRAIEEASMPISRRWPGAGAGPC